MAFNFNVKDMSFFVRAIFCIKRVGHPFVNMIIGACKTMVVFCVFHGLLQTFSTSLFSGTVKALWRLGPEKVEVSYLCTLLTLE